MQIFKDITKNECVNERKLHDNWKTVRDKTYFRIIHFDITHKIQIGIRNSDPELPTPTCINSTVADFLRGLHSLAENWSWERDINGRQ